MSKKKIVSFIIILIILMLCTDYVYNVYQKKYTQMQTRLTKELNTERVGNTGLITKNNPVEQTFEISEEDILLTKVGLFFGTGGRKNKGNINIKLIDEEVKAELVNQDINLEKLDDNSYYYVELSKPVLTNNICIFLTSQSEDTDNAVTLWTNESGYIGVEIEYYKAPMKKGNFKLVWGAIALLIIMVLFVISKIIKGYIQLSQNIKQHIDNFVKYRTLLKELVVKDLKLKYKRSVLGFVWSVLNPLLMMCIMTLVFSTLFKSDIQNFPVYLILGQTVFTYFSEATTCAMGAVVSNSSLISKVYIPKYIFPMSKVIYALCNFLFSMVAVIIVMIFTKVKITSAIIMFPIGIVYLTMFALGIGLILAAYGVFFRDITHLYGVLILAWTYLTPIFYPISIIPENILLIVKANPMNHFITYFRQVVMYGEIPSVTSNLICFIYGFVVLLIGTIIFYKKQDKFILYI